MEQKILFKVWNCFRTKKTAILLNNSDPSLYEQLILKASEKLEIDGSILVLESDGTVVDENEALLYLHKEIFILLQKNELWMPLIIHSAESSLPSTVTNDSQISETDDSLKQSIMFYQIDQENVSPQCSSAVEKVVSGPTVPISEQLLHVLNPPESIVSEDFWRKFLIPWEKLPDKILKEINDGKRGKHIEDEVLSLIIREMRTIQTRIPLNHFRIIVHKIIEKSPKTFQDIDDDGVVLGDGSSTLLFKLKDRNNYKNQLAKRRFGSEAPPVSKKRKKSSDIFVDEKSNLRESTSVVDAVDVTSNITKLNQDFHTLSDSDLFELLSKTYQQQRTFLQINPSINQIKETWPCLLDERVIHWHYGKLMGHELAQLEVAINIKLDRMLAYLHSKRSIKKVPTELALKQLELLKGLTKYFRESFDYILKVLPGLSHVEEVNSLSPCIVLAQDEDKYYVVIENITINEGSSSFIPALEQFYASFFIFNMKYPDKANATLEVLQRYFMKTHPDSGTKSNTFSKSKSAVIRFLKSLSDYISKEDH